MKKVQEPQKKKLRKKTIIIRGKIRRKENDRRRSLRLAIAKRRVYYEVGFLFSVYMFRTLKFERRWTERGGGKYEKMRRELREGGRERERHWD